jgi:hypothetical protein
MAFMNRLELVVRAVSLGDAETLVQHPAGMTHATYSADERKRHGISDSLLRLSVGLENVEDLMADIAQALDHVHASKGKADWARSARRPLFQSIALGFLGASRFRRENPWECLLDFLGFPWILSSESRVINGLREINDKRFFSSLLFAALARGTAGSPSWQSQGQDCSWGELMLDSDFPQPFVAWAIPLSRLISKAARFTIERSGRTAHGNQTPAIAKIRFGDSLEVSYAV